MSTTPNMNLTLPIVSQTTGPTWANQINADLSVIDAHNHIASNGGGVPITTAAMNIDADLSFATYSAIGLGSVEMINQASTPSERRIYLSGGNLWYSYNGTTPVQITNGSNLAATPGNIAGLVYPASVIYDPASFTFSFYSNQTPPAQLGVLVSSQIRLRAAASASPVSIATSPSASTYTLTLPTAAPGSQGIVGFATNGVLSAVTADSTMSISSSTIGVAASGITATEIHSDAVETAKIKDKAVTQIKMENKSTSGTTADGVNVGPTNTVVFSSFTANFIAGRPVLIALDCLQSTGTAPAPVPAASSIVANGNPSMYIAVTHPNGTTQTQMGHFIFGSGYSSPASVQAIFNVVSSGTHTIELASYCGTMLDGIVLSNGFFKAFQL